MYRISWANDHLLKIGGKPDRVTICWGISLVMAPSNLLEQLREVTSNGLSFAIPGDALPDKEVVNDGPRTPKSGPRRGELLEECRKLLTGQPMQLRFQFCTVETLLQEILDLPEPRGLVRPSNQV
jgi:hypothetical protein